MDVYFVFFECSYARAKGVVLLLLLQVQLVGLPGCTETACMFKLCLH
jgi:hypothetical protein